MSKPHTLSLEPRRDVYTVSRLNQEVRLLLEQALPLLWVEGEISNLSQPRSGHLYFTLKDEAAQVRCAMFHNRSLYLRFRPQESLHVRVRAKIGLYAPRGDFQLIVEHMEEAGDGALRRAFEALKSRLAEEGLFAAEHKKPLPTLPRRLGVVTSPSGAALRDVLTVLRRRFPAIRVLIYPVAVQGVNAPREITAMIRVAARRREVDALLLTRGGGSLEDLWAFNEESVARAIYECPLPIVSAVGHETDTTIADFVADQRAPTPSAGAELLSPDGPSWLARIEHLGERLQRGLRRGVGRQSDGLGRLERRLANQHPGRRLQERAQRLDELEQRITRAERTRRRELTTRYGHLAVRLRRQDPRHRARERAEQISALRRRLHAVLGQGFHNRRQLLTGTVRALEAVSPLKTLGRGYAIVRRERDDRIVRRPNEVAPGERISARLSGGELVCRVEALREANEIPTLPRRSCETDE